MLNISEELMYVNSELIGKKVYMKLQNYDMLIPATIISIESQSDEDEDGIEIIGEYISVDRENNIERLLLRGRAIYLIINDIQVMTYDGPKALILENNSLVLKEKNEIKGLFGAYLDLLLTKEITLRISIFKNKLFKNLYDIKKQLSNLKIENTYFVSNGIYLEINNEKKLIIDYDIIENNICKNIDKYEFFKWCCQNIYSINNALDYKKIFELKITNYNIFKMK